jgi:hypothetical protein
MKKDLLLFSDYNKVLQNAKKYIKEPFYLEPSTRRDKKYMISINNKITHFGGMNPPMEDYTKHNDDRRRDLFRKRNARWKDSPKYSAAWLSYFLLW